eukprot:TRINITY_DN37339_c0_g1_i1.p1 TRINITY_DN37339_c0_g1~~TRINITY_DN37339_c0_g1_i1.p1  ORF type:complete len:562 (+),score=119.39 TRINITY_DN37339_c0_g1_i1:62-1747(+)
MSQSDASPFISPVHHSQLGNHESDNPNWATWSNGCRIESASGENPTGILTDDGNWDGDGEQQKVTFKLLNGHPSLHFIGWDGSDSAQRTVMFHSGVTPHTMTRRLKGITLPGKGYQIWELKKCIPTTHQYVTMEFMDELFVPINRLYLFEHSPTPTAPPKATLRSSSSCSITEAERVQDTHQTPAPGSNIMALAEELGIYSNGIKVPQKVMSEEKKSPTPPGKDSSNGSVRRKIQKSKLVDVLDGLDSEVRKLHRVRNVALLKGGNGGGVSPPPQSPTPTLPAHCSALEADISPRSSSTVMHDAVSHPSATRINPGTRAVHNTSTFIEHENCSGIRTVSSTPSHIIQSHYSSDPAWMTVFKSYDDRLARCENQVQRILAILEVRGEQEAQQQQQQRQQHHFEKQQAAAAAVEKESPLTGIGFPAAEMQSLVLEWIKPTLSKWAKAIEKKITRTINCKVDDSFERITKSTIDKKVKQLLSELDGYSREQLKREVWKENTPPITSDMRQSNVRQKSSSIFPSKPEPLQDILSAPTDYHNDSLPAASLPMRKGSTRVLEPIMQP